MYTEELGSLEAGMFGRLMSSSLKRGRGRGFGRALRHGLRRRRDMPKKRRRIFGRPLRRPVARRIPVGRAIAPASMHSFKRIIETIRPKPRPTRSHIPLNRITPPRYFSMGGSAWHKIASKTAARDKGLFPGRGLRRGMFSYRRRSW